VGRTTRSDILRALNVDFARPRQWPIASIWALALLVLALAGWAGLRDRQTWRVLFDEREKTAMLHSQLDVARVAQEAHAASAAELPGFALDAKRWMALAMFDSSDVLRSVESAQVAGAKVVLLDIDGESRRVELEVEVASADVAAAYLQALNAGVDRPVWVLSRLQAQGGTESALIRGQIP
jgi:hypothetical protein